jgi:hypothetical protein
MLSLRKITAVISLLGLVAVAAGAVPAFTADNGSIAGTVTATAPPAPCIQLSTTSLDFGTTRFAVAPQTSSVGISGAITFTNCSTAVSSFGVAGTDATGPAGPWTLTDGWRVCDGRLNRYGLLWWDSPEGFNGDNLSTTPKTLTHHRGTDTTVVQTFDAGESDAFRFSIYMPCVGSNGAGQTYSFGIGLTATVA